MPFTSMRYGYIAILLLAASALAQAPTPANSAPPLRWDCNSTWLNDDVRWIITLQERASFCMLRTDEERQQFIENLWTHRDPTPTTFENEFEDEHYRRLAYANDHFGDKLPGRLTDRGRIYVEFGQPDLVEPCAGTATAATCLLWHYGSLAGLGSATFEFQKSTGDWMLTHDPSGGKNASELGGGIVYAPWSTRQTQKGRIIQYVGAVMPPTVRFKDLEEVVTHKISYESKLSMKVTTSAEKVTNATDLVTIRVAVPNSALQWSEEHAARRMHVEIFERLSNLSGRIVQTNEDELNDSISDAKFAEHSGSAREYESVVPLPPGRYRLDVVVRDAKADKVGWWSHGVIVPEFPADVIPEVSAK